MIEREDIFDDIVKKIKGLKELTLRDSNAIIQENICYIC